MSVHQFGGEADVVGHDGAHTFLVESVGAGAAQDGLDAATREESVPEGIVLVHTESSRETDGERTLSGGGRMGG